VWTDESWAIDNFSIGSGGASATGSISETNASGLTASGNLVLADVDTTNTVATQIYSVVASGTGNNPGMTLTNSQLLALMTLANGSLTNTQTSKTMTWTFNSGSNTFDYLAAGEKLILTYTIRATDSNSPAATVDREVVITINGTNDSPSISLGSGDSASASFTESDSGKSVSGAVTVTDLDLTNTVTAVVQSVVKTGITSGIVPGDAALLSMMTVSPTSPTVLIGSTSTTASLSWAFDSGAEAFN